MEVTILRRYFFLGILILAFQLAACGPAETELAAEGEPGQVIQTTGGSYRDLSVAELQAMFENKEFEFINVHIPFEGDIPNTDGSIPFDQIADRIAELPANKDAKIILYCRSGNMSSQAARTLVELGYTNIWNLSGGFNAWKAVGLKMAGE